jgi:hypothetical protein
MNTLAIYYRRRYIPRKPAMEFWADPVLGLLADGQPFLDHRDAQRKDGKSQWLELRAFADAARRYQQQQSDRKARAAARAATSARTGMSPVREGTPAPRETPGAELTDRPGG